MDLNKTKEVYMIGIKGVGMTMLAQFLIFRGVKVSGSDVKEKFMTDKVLKKNKIKIIEGFDKENIPEDVDLIIYSTAYNSKTNQEVAKVLKGNYRVLTYAEALAEIFNKYYGIAVIGSHGKTTTTAWLGYV
ncbi:UDP-N-acetylmuramate--L-alanine ligase, partial [bacterium]|nr:UDP-N-acetylmuramate--L-alanine ligase [bacterium]